MPKLIFLLVTGNGAVGEEPGIGNVKPIAVWRERQADWVVARGNLSEPNESCRIENYDAKVCLV